MAKIEFFDTNAENEVHYSGDAPDWRWHLKADNGEIVAQGEGHATREDAERAAATAKRLFAEAEVG